MKPKRRHSAADYFNLALGLGVLLAMAAGGIYLIVTGISQHKAGEIIGGAFLAVIGGALPVFLGAKLLEGGVRKAAPGAAPPKITVALQGTQCAPGATVAGRVEVAQGGHARKLEVSLRCHDRTAVYQGVSWTSAAAALATGDLTAPSSHSFAIELPRYAPPTFTSGSGASIWWEVDARCDVLGSDVHATQRIEVAAPTDV